MLVKLGMWLLGLVYLAWGMPAVVAPKWFFGHFPGAGQHWTAAYPPYNEHLMTDVGVAAITMGAMLIVAAVIGEPRVMALALGAVAFYEALHLVYHLLHRGQMSDSSNALSLAGLLAGVVFPLALLIADRIRSGRDRQA
jgi:hypothetical protein